MNIFIFRNISIKRSCWRKWNIINKIPADTNYAIQKWHEFKDSDDPSPGITGISFSAPCYVAGSFFIQRYKGQ